ncbi:MAG TPA: beta-N-acetylhexosaminidase [Verrucomicrobiae bacterium]|nr:beta-N-acetylhexosaminidase [Verrucomicrobiae bacterium]
MSKVVAILAFALLAGSLCAASVTWNTPAPITYGIGLGSNQLNATTAGSGTFIYTPPAGTILSQGTHTLSAVFAPAGTNGNNGSTNTVNLVVLPAALNIIPLPQTSQIRPGLFTLCPTLPTPNAPGRATTRILADGPSLQTAQYLAALLLKSTGCQFIVSSNTTASAVKGAIVLSTTSTNSALGPEGYQLTVAPDSVIIQAPAGAGVFYGAQTFLQLFPPQIFAQHPVTGVAWVAPCAYIQDQPRFPWRGCMLDVSRHFHTPDEIERLLDVMAVHKLNTFHWHLVDDQGWRIQIMQYPLLTQVGAWRTNIDYGLNPLSSGNYNTNGMYGGFYTQADIRDIVAYAQQRYITIVPEIEMPAHSTAGVASYPQFACSAGPFNMDIINYEISLYSLAAPGTQSFLQEVLTEVMGLFPGPYIHTGGDEVVAASWIWNSTPADEAEMATLGITPNGSNSVIRYQHWFSTNMANFVQSNGRKMVGWTETEAGGILTNMVLMDWESGTASAAVPAAEAGQQVVTTPDASCYYNYYQSTNYAVEPLGQSGYTPLNAAYNYDPVPTNLPEQYASNILGSEGVLFGEYLPSLTNLEFRAFPRLCAMAELTWTPAAMKNYTNFTQRLATHELRLTQMGVNYDATNIFQLGNWTPSLISTSPGTLTWNVTTNVPATGEMDVSFWHTSGANGLSIYSVTLLENGIPISQDAHTGFAGDGPSDWVYIVHLPERKPGAIYTLKASVAGRGGTASFGNVYLPNWN